MTGSKIWAQQPHSLNIELGEVHVWRAELDRSDGVVQELRETLATDEIDRANRFHFERHRRDFIVARGLLRYLIGLYLGVEPKALKFSYGPYGKPELEGLHQLRFNISHSHGIALYAFSKEMDIGVDVEHMRADFATEDIAQRFFSAVEVENLCALSGEEQVEAFFRCWTRKEAFIKVTGRGLSQSLDGFDVTLAPAVPAALLRVSDDEAERWELFDVEVGEGYAGALAVEGKVSSLRLWELR